MADDFRIPCDYREALQESMTMDDEKLIGNGEGVVLRPPPGGGDDQDLWAYAATVQYPRQGNIV